MIKGSEKRQPGHAIHPLIVDRWSPRAMSGESIGKAELDALLEAARWAPSSGNVQPWRIVYATRDTPQWTTFLELLVEPNRVWAQHAAALLLFVSDGYNEFMKMPATTNSYDTGAAWQNLALQGYHAGLVVHGMAGFDYDAARTKLKIPERFKVEAMAAVGRPGPLSQLPEKYQEREVPSDRKPLAQITCEGEFAW